jgi:transposase-like protein
MSAHHPATEDDMPKHSPHTPEQRAEIVLAYLRKEEPAETLCRRHGISDSTLARWRDEFLAGGTAALGAGKTQQSVQSRRIEELEQSLAGRDQVIGELTIANRILKKTVGPG